MRIQLLLPFINDDANNTYLRGFVPPEVDIVGLKNGRVAETLVDVALTLNEEIETIVEAEKDGYDAVVVGCALDPGVVEARELVKIPVLGCYQVTLHFAAILGNRLTVIVPSGRYGIRMQKQNAKRYGFENVLFRSVRFKGRESLEQAALYQEEGKANEAVDEVAAASIQAIENDDADVLMIGGNALAWVAGPVQEQLRAKGYEIPFLVPITTAIEVARTLVNLGLSHSNLFYPRFD